MPVAAYNLGFYLLDEYVSPLKYPPLSPLRRDNFPPHCGDLWRDQRNPSIDAFVKYNWLYVNNINKFINALRKKQSMPNIAKLAQPDIECIDRLEVFLCDIMQPSKDILLFPYYSHILTRYGSKEYTEKIIATTLNKNYFKKILRTLKVKIADGPDDEPINTTDFVPLPISHPHATMLWYQHEEPTAIASYVLSDLQEKARQRFDQRNSQSIQQALYTQPRLSFCIDDNKGQTHAFYTIKLPGIPAFYQTHPHNKTYLLSLSDRKKLFRLHLK